MMILIHMINVFMMVITMIAAVVMLLFAWAPAMKLYLSKLFRGIQTCAFGLHTSSRSNNTSSGDHDDHTKTYSSIQ